MTEVQIERRLVLGVKKAGGMCLKFTSPSTRGVPDRIVILPGGRVIFVELKTEKGRLSEIQKHVIGEMTKLGAEGCVLRGLDGVETFLREIGPNEI